MSEKIIRRVKAPEFLDFIECPACAGIGIVLYEAHTDVVKRKLCEACGGQGFMMSKQTREALKAVLDGRPG